MICRPTRRDAVSRLGAAAPAGVTVSHKGTTGTIGLQVRGGIYSGAGDAFISMLGEPSSSRSVMLANQA